MHGLGGGVIGLLLQGAWHGDVHGLGGGVIGLLLQGVWHGRRAVLATYLRGWG